MKKILFILTLLSIVGCGIGTSQSDLELKTNVEKEFPNYIEIKRPTGVRFRWLVIDADSSLWYVETMNNFNCNVSGKELIYKLKETKTK